MKAPARRSLLYGAVAALSAVGGVGAWWGVRPAPESVPSSPTPGFWQLIFPTPAGAALTMAAFRGQPLLLNFWATWCPPCVEELPLLDAFFRENAFKGWQVIGIAVDRAQAVSAFLRRTPVAYPMAVAGLQGAELARQLGNDGRGLPFTLVLDSQGEVMTRKIGPLAFRDLQAWVQASGRR